ncbi:MAG TPA: hypothetical protein VLC91_11395, partial [Spongiibacteraceae bacterium]|nr:hypothetical protein [Spongiibacteraceae bacterium]
EPIVMGRMERLREDLPAMLAQVGQSVTPEMRAFIDQAPPQNTSKHGSIRDTYETELAELVAERDARVIARHGYTFD